MRGLRRLAALAFLACVAAPDPGAFTGSHRVGPTASPRHRVEIVACVLSVPQHRPHRDAVRTGWGQFGASLNAVLWFVVSKRDPGYTAISDERAARGDVLTCDVATGFDRIASKVSCALSAALDRFHFDWWIKTDDDATLCLGKILNELRSATFGAQDFGVYAGRKLKFARQLAGEKPLARNLGLTHDPPHFGGHGYAVSRRVAAHLVTASNAAPLYHHLHEDTNFGLWMLGLAVKRVNLNSMLQWHFPNDGGLAAVGDLQQKAKCAQLLQQRNAGGDWDLYACGMKKLPQTVPAHCREADARPPLEPLNASAPAVPAPPAGAGVLLAVVAATASPDERQKLRAALSPRNNGTAGHRLYLVAAEAVDAPPTRPAADARSGALAEARAYSDVFVPKPGHTLLRAVLGAVGAAGACDYVALLLGEAAFSLEAGLAGLGARHSGMPHIYAGAAVVRGAKLDAALDRALGIGAAPAYASGGVVLSGSLARYLVAAAGEEGGPSALLEPDVRSAAAMKPEGLYQLVGLWLSPFDVDRTPQPRWFEKPPPRETR
ncbi:hypothetical protein M885DRAFT_521488 [Pelagophyceae sp. CCMP2097]|nr:hypothetical protein M885DRAFT_521488 [Pelagophyceae sp. CCMP2097]